MELQHEDDAICKEAVEENLEVIQRMRGRLRILREEVEGRGERWVWGDVVNGDGGGNGEHEEVELDGEEGERGGERTLEGKDREIANGQSAPVSNGVVVSEDEEGSQNSSRIRLGGATRNNNHAVTVGRDDGEGEEGAGAGEGEREEEEGGNNGVFL